MIEFAELRHDIGWTTPHIAGRLEMSERQVRRWDAGEAEPPARVLEWLRDVKRAVDAIPPPAKPTKPEATAFRCR